MKNSQFNKVGFSHRVSLVTFTNGQMLIHLVTKTSYQIFQRNYFYYFKESEKSVWQTHIWQQWVCRIQNMTNSQFYKVGFCHRVSLVTFANGQMLIHLVTKTIYWIVREITFLFFLNHRKGFGKLTFGNSEFVKCKIWQTPCSTK